MEWVYAGKSDRKWGNLQEVVGGEHGRKKGSFRKCMTGNWDARKRGDGLRDGDSPGIERRWKSQRPVGGDGSGFEGDGRQGGEGVRSEC